MKYERIIGIVPLGIGLSTLVFVWSSQWNEFGPPPFFFRIFFSFIALSFALSGAGILFGNVTSIAERLKATQRELHESGLKEPVLPDSPPSPGKLKCPNCGSSPQTGEVSPHGDVKCDHCSRWYNVHTA